VKIIGGFSDETLQGLRLDTSTVGVVSVAVGRHAFKPRRPMLTSKLRRNEIFGNRKTHFPPPEHGGSYP